MAGFKAASAAGDIANTLLFVPVRTIEVPQTCELPSRASDALHGHGISGLERIHVPAAALQIQLTFKFHRPIHRSSFADDIHQDVDVRIRPIHLCDPPGQRGRPGRVELRRNGVVCRPEA